MIVTIELSASEAARLQDAASKSGTEMAELAHRLLANQLPSAPINGQAGGNERDPELVARVKSIRGKFARNPGEGFGSDELHRERRKDSERTEAAIRDVKL